ncbi:MAG TPA: hypothetical protein VL832_20475 [Puia sp.]|nr:hypothetical protein [Puia sp.]
MLKNTTFLRKKILFIIGSPNQTTQMHQIASRLREYDCYFSQIYSRHPVIRLAVKSGLLDNTILSGEFRRKGDAYLEQHRLRNDYARSIYRHRYDMAVLCTDLLVTKELRSIKTVWVQEGMTDPITPWASLSRRMGLPSYMAMNTAFNGCGNICDIYCAASPGYKEQFSRLGTEASRILVTGIPNYDHAAALLENNFPHRGYVMVATSDTRETFKKDDREKFIKDCVKIAGGRRLLFKLHPNEQKDRAMGEIRSFAPSDALIYTEGNTEHMIANCDELITQYSTVVYIGIALGKKVHSYFEVEKLKKLAPVQNGGESAALIADICRRYIEFGGTRDEFLTGARPDMNKARQLKFMGQPNFNLLT